MQAGVEVALEWGLGAAAVAGMAVGGFAYASLWPGSRLFGRALVAPRQPGELALTFDDGPNAAWTPRLLDSLAAEGVVANLFVMGEHADREPALARRAQAEGHLLGVHSWSHPNLARSPERVIREELRRSRESLEQVLGEPVRFFRPPFGARRPAVFRVAHEMELTTVLWNAMTNDWAEPDAARIVERLSAKIDRLTARGWAANVVLHDGGHLDPAANREPSVTAAARLAARYKATHRFVRLDAWA